MRIAHYVVMLGLIGAGCAEPPRRAPVQRSVLERLGDLTPEVSDRPVEYVIRFEDRAAARRHESEITRRGGRVKALDAEGRVLSVQASHAELAKVAVTESVSIAPNSGVRITPPAELPVATPTDQESAVGDPAEAFLTARSVVGVEELVARFPAADGRGQKVAVFDTGIDFGIEGVSAGGKLVGYYDFTDFGLVEAKPIEEREAPHSVEIAGRQVTFAPDLDVAAVYSVGTLSEAALSRSYLASGVDINGDGDSNDEFPFAIGALRRGGLAVWIDADQNGTFADAAREQLTDYNTTHQFVVWRPELSASGQRPLAVTIRDKKTVQFHVVVAGHGTSVGVVIAGDEYANTRLRGMAPKAKLVSYVLDVTGQDVYTLDQFLKMWLHAKEQGVDAINVSWGFTTADLASARFVADFLDKEIASAGIVIGIAAGNNGPGVATAYPDDYIPRHGFGVGAYVSKEQARNVYGWVGAEDDGVIWYSSYGPTRGGRQIPDVVSPLMTLVRRERTATGPYFYAFGGTSSATPALIGAVTALSSALKAAGETAIDPRLIKLAVQNTAHPIEGEWRIRQGAGLIDVNRAYDLYLKLVNEKRRAEADPAKRGPYPVELRAETALPHETERGEGIHLWRYQPTATIDLKMSEESLKALDPGTAIEIVSAERHADWYEAQDVLTLQPNGAARLQLRFDREKLKEPGIYHDVLTITRRDGLALLWIPVVVEIPARANSLNVVAEIGQTMAPLALWREPVRLEGASSLTFDGVVTSDEGNENAVLMIALNSSIGQTEFLEPVRLTRGVQRVTVTTPELRPGDYELLVFRHFGQPASLAPISVHGAFRLPAVQVEASAVNGGAVSLAIEANEAMNIASADLAIEGVRHVTTLALDKTRERPGYYGLIEFGAETQVIGMGLEQSQLYRAIEPFLHMSVALIDSTSHDPVYRGWVNVKDPGLASTVAELSKGVTEALVVAYPNVVDWNKVETPEVRFYADVPLKDAVTLTASWEKGLQLSRGQRSRLVFALGEGQALPEGSFGRLTLKDASGAVIDKIHVRF